ncbi:hypothetical protein FGIG_07803 [Fasciola gigantica]|uniref:Uncharacterized protein n=1 Tax=Fasciola gigantica TaxID=46835 RepID=A0A504YST3_FASGI|nr:hypothetical protein FGIG_07803 [Fasciola gigantica]
MSAPLPDTTQFKSVELTDSERNDIMDICAELLCLGNPTVQRARAIAFAHANSITYLPNPASTFETHWRWSGFTQRPPVHPRDLQPLSLCERWARPTSPGFDASVFPSTAFAAAARLAAAAALSNVQRTPVESGLSQNRASAVGTNYPYSSSHHLSNSSTSRIHPINSFPVVQHEYPSHARASSIYAPNMGINMDQNPLEHALQYHQWPGWDGRNMNDPQAINLPGSTVSAPRLYPSSINTPNQQNDNSSMKLIPENSVVPNPCILSGAPDPSTSTSSLRPDSSCSQHKLDTRQTTRDCVELLRQWLTDSNYGPGYIISNSTVDRRTRCVAWASRFLTQANSLLYRIRLDWNALYQGERSRSTGEEQAGEDEDESECEFFDEQIWLCRMRNPVGLQACPNRTIPGQTMSAPLPDTTQFKSVELTDSERNDIMMISVPKLIVLVTIQDHFLAGSTSLSHIMNSIRQECNQSWQGNNTLLTAGGDHGIQWAADTIHVKPESGSVGTEPTDWIRKSEYEILYKLVSILRSSTPDLFEWSCLKALILFEEPISKRTTMLESVVRMTLIEHITGLATVRNPTLAEDWMVKNITYQVASRTSKLFQVTSILQRLTKVIGRNLSASAKGARPE